MSLSTTVQKASFNLTGTTGPFTFTFPFTDNSHILVYIDDVLQTLGTHYTLTGAGSLTGGAVTLVTAVASGVLVVERVLPLTQPTVLANQGPFFAATHEAVFDRLTMMIQQIWDRANRSIRMPKDSAEGYDLITEEYTSRHNKVFGFNSLGQLALVAANYVTSSGVLGNPWADVRGYASLAAAIADLGGTNIDLVIWGAQSVDADLTVPANIRLVVKNGGTINVASGKTLTINGEFVCPVSQCFTGDGTVKFGSASVINIYPEWFGTLTLDGSTDNSAVIQKAINSADTTAYDSYDVIIPPLCVFNIKTADHVIHGGTSYRCILAHTSGAASEPGVGGSWETYWEIDTADSGIAWATSTAYVASATGITLKKNVRLIDNSYPYTPRILSNQHNISGAVNEWGLAAPFHPGIILDAYTIYDIDTMQGSQVYSGRASMIWRVNGYSKWQMANDVNADGTYALTIYSNAQGKQCVTYFPNGSTRYGRKTSKQDFTTPAYTHVFSKNVCLEEDDGTNISLVFRTLNSSTDAVVYRKIVTMSATDGHLLISNTANTETIFELTDSGCARSKRGVSGGAFTTANRNALTVVSGDIGMMVYDSTLGKPVWLHSISPSVWHDAAGSVV